MTVSNSCFILKNKDNQGFSPPRPMVASLTRGKKSRKTNEMSSQRRLSTSPSRYRGSRNSSSAVYEELTPSTSDVSRWPVIGAIVLGALLLVGVVVGVSVATTTRGGISVGSVSRGATANWPRCGDSCGQWKLCCSSQNTGGGWGFENGASCIIGDGEQASRCLSCGRCEGWPQCCFGDKFDPDGDGWGWEGGETCIVPGGAHGRNCPATGGGGTNPPTNPPPPVTSPSGSCPSQVSCPAGMQCGCYIKPGLGANKRGYLAVGATPEFLASAMMETEMTDTNYVYGDGKSGDAWNGGATKQNWGMMRICHKEWNQLGPNDFNVGAILNSNRTIDVQVYKECRALFTGQRWFAGHRNGSSGLSNPDTEDIRRFIIGYEWTLANIATHLDDDVRFWVSIPAI